MSLRPIQTGRIKRARDLVVLMVGATAQPGPALAETVARRGARLVVLDHDAAALDRLAGQCGGRIEPLLLPQDETQTLELLGAAWAAEPLDMVLNLAPLQDAPDINAQVARLSQLMRSTARGLKAGKGCLVTVMARPDDPLKLQATGLCAALQACSTALAQVFSKSGVRVHSVAVPKAAPQRALPLLTQLAYHRLDDLPGTPFVM